MGPAFRAYIYVEDIADAKTLVLDHITPGFGRRYKVATGIGDSVRQGIESGRKVAGHAIRTVEKPRRAGDLPELVTSADAIRRELGWTARHLDPDSNIQSAWNWHKSLPHGYRDPSKS